MKKFTLTTLTIAAICAALYFVGFRNPIINLITSPYTYIVYLALALLFTYLETLYLEDEIKNQNEGIEHITNELEGARTRYFDLINSGGLNNEAVNTALKNSNIRYKKKLDRIDNFKCELLAYATKEMNTSDEIPVKEMVKALETDLQNI